LLQLRHPKFWLALGWVMVFVVIGATLMPAKAVEVVLGGLNDKIEHAIAYAGLMAWFGGMFRRGAQLRVGAALVILGGVLELLQGLTPTRTPDITDLAADAVGVLLGLASSTTVLHAWCQRIEARFPVR
jgi:VanZ family protein